MNNSCRNLRVVVLFFASLILFIGCRKKTKVYSITGKLLESSGNPVPIANYKIAMYQRSSGGFGIPSSYSSSEAAAITDQTGNFNIRYMPGKGFFLGIPSSSASPLSLNGKDTLRKNFYWNNLPAQKDTALQNVYLYKLIKSCIIKVKLGVQILPGDTIKITAPNKAGNYNKTITGLSIPANTETQIDNIADVVFSYFDLWRNSYSSEISIQIKRSGSTGFNFLGPDYRLSNLSRLDEQQRDFTFY